MFVCVSERVCVYKSSMFKSEKESNIFNTKFEKSRCSLASDIFKASILLKNDVNIIKPVKYHLI
jgi:hypothetical protein